MGAPPSVERPILECMAAAVLGGALVPSGPWPAAACAAWVSVMLGRFVGTLTAVTFALAFVASATRSLATVRSFERTRLASIERGSWPQKCTIHGMVIRSPAFINDAVRVTVEARELSCVGTAVPLGTVSLFAPPHEAAHLARGDEVYAIANVAPPYVFLNENAQAAEASAALRNILYSGGAEFLERTRPFTWWRITGLIDLARARVRSRINASFSVQHATMCRALVLGEDNLSSEDAAAFRTSGLSHLLAVSGMHLVLVVMSFVSALTHALRLSVSCARQFDVRRWAASAGVVLAWMYADFAGGSGSAIRAAWMCSVSLGAVALGRRISSMRALCLSIFAMALLSPLVSVDLSFLLSVHATAGLLLLGKPIDEKLGRLPKWIRAPISATVSATCACAPVLSTMAPQLSLSGIVANLIAVPVGEAAALPLCLLHSLLWWAPHAERGAALAASGALSIVKAIAYGFSWGTVPLPAPSRWQLAILAATTASWLVARKRRWLITGAVVLAATELWLRRDGAPHGALRVTFMDVGQGDAALVDLPDGSAMLIDGGGLVGSPIDVGQRVIAPMLAARRRTHLRAVVLSHPHPDHYLGLGSALEGPTVEEVWDTGQGEAEHVGGAYAAWLASARSKGSRVVRPEGLCGTQVVGGAHIDVLAPCPAPDPDHGPNDNSFVLRIRYGNRAVLFMGDAEHTEENALVRRFSSSDALRTDVIKVGHHGSRTSSAPAFLVATHATWAVISCGVRNRFGHPHPNTLQSLHSAHINVLRTDRNGNVAVTTDGTNLTIESAQ